MTAREVERRMAIRPRRCFSFRTACLLLCLACLFPVPLRAEQADTVRNDPPSNEDFLRAAIRSLVERTFAAFPAKDSELLIVKPEEEHPAGWLLEDELVTYLSSQDREVALQSVTSSHGPDESRSLFYRIIDMSLSYPEVRRKGFLGGRLLTRRASLNLSFRLEDGATGKVLWSERAKEERSDLIRRSMASSVNNGTYPFLCPSLPDDPQSRYVEPALVVAVVGGLVYLFFANR